MTTTTAHVAPTDTAPAPTPSPTDTAPAPTDTAPAPSPPPGARPEDSWGPPPHLTPATMARAQRLLVRKALAEFSHERLVHPVPEPPTPPDTTACTPDTTAPDTTSPAPDTTAPAPDTTAPDTTAPAPDTARPHLLAVDGGRVTYRFTARTLALEHWVIDPDSLVREVDGRPAPLDVQELVVELREDLGLPEALLGTYLEEIAATLAGAAWKDHHQRLTSADLVHADFQTVEAAMTEGHPGFVANNGRIGFGAQDSAAYTPEAARPVRLVWLAAHRAHTTLSCGRGTDEERLYSGQLDPRTRRAFADRLGALGLDPADHLYLPVHPWQWEHRLQTTFAPDLADRRLVPVGTGPDRYQPQQAIRTLFDTDDPRRHYVKTALAIQNMGFLRGLSPRYMRGTPAINDWVADRVRGDATLHGCGFDVLREVAAIGYTGDAYHRGDVPMPQQRMVAALWRESPVPRTGPGERPVTMASLLHRDRDGAPLVTAMIDASPLAAHEWLRRYLHAYLRPLVHCLLAHDLAFMPHGENVILVLADHVPTRVFLKDIGEEVAVLGDAPLPPEVERVRTDADAELAALAVFTDVFDGFLRHLAGVLDTSDVLPCGTFWDLVGECVARHAREHPALHRRVDLFAPDFAHSCLNRLQLRNTLQMVDLADQSGSLLFAGRMPNPVAGARPR